LASFRGRGEEERADPAAEGLADGIEEKHVPNRIANSQYALAPGDHDK
jgi:hypothetical protein